MSKIPPRIELVVPTYLVEFLEKWYLASANGSLTLHFHDGEIQRMEEHRTFKPIRIDSYRF